MSVVLKEKEDQAADVNLKRKGDQERNLPKIQQLTEEWNSLVEKNLQIEVSLTHSSHLLLIFLF